MMRSMQFLYHIDDTWIHKTLFNARVYTIEKRDAENEMDKVYFFTILSVIWRDIPLRNACRCSLNDIFPCQTWHCRLIYPWMAPKLEVKIKLPRSICGYYGNVDLICIWNCSSTETPTATSCRIINCCARVDIRSFGLTFPVRICCTWHSRPLHRDVQ